jgi:hypothetical protein
VRATSGRPSGSSVSLCATAVDRHARSDCLGNGQDRGLDDVTWRGSAAMNAMVSATSSPRRHSMSRRSPDIKVLASVTSTGTAIAVPPATVMSWEARPGTFAPQGRVEPGPAARCETGRLSRGARWSAPCCARGRCAPRPSRS